MLVSIITPTFNSEKHIAQTANSIINQTFTDWEWIVVDDHSTDNTINILKEIEAKDDRIKCVFLTKNGGSGSARNKAIELANGKYIAFLDSDDIWTTNKLELHIEFMRSNNYALSHTSYGFIDEKGQKKKDTIHVGSDPITYNMMLKKNHIGCLTAVYDQEIIGKMFMPDLRQKQDYALWLSIMRNGLNSYPLEKELAFYRTHNESVTNNKLKLIFKHWVLLNKFEKLNWFKALYYTIYWGLSGIKKHYL